MAAVLAATHLLLVLQPAPSRPPQHEVVGTRVLTSGVATWYDNGPGLYAAAGPALRHGQWRGERVRVCAAGRCVIVRIVDWCACPGDRIIDLSPAAFSRLAPLSRGVVSVEVSL